MSVQRYVKKPVVIEAVRWTGDNLSEVKAFVGGYVLDGGRLHISTLEGLMLASVGDFIIRGVKGEFYPCKPDVFDATYAPAKNELEAPVEWKTICYDDEFWEAYPDHETGLDVIRVNDGRWKWTANIDRDRHGYEATEAEAKAAAEKAAREMK